MSSIAVGWSGLIGGSVAITVSANRKTFAHGPSGIRSFQSAKTNSVDITEARLVVGLHAKRRGWCDQASPCFRRCYQVDGDTT